MNLKQFFSSSIGKKLIMAVTGLFLITFLIIHLALNSCALIDDGGVLFNKGAHFMATNPLIRIMEVVLFAGLLFHIFDGLKLTFENQKKRPVKYAVAPGNATSKWYSRSMGLLGTLLLIFLIVHIGDFWVKSRITGLDEITVGHEQMHDLYVRMKITFSNPIMVGVYTLAMVSLAYHLMHGFQSAFQTLGWNHPKYTPMIKGFGKWFSIIMAIGFAIIPIVIYLRHN